MRCWVRPRWRLHRKRRPLWWRTLGWGAGERGAEGEAQAGDPTMREAPCLWMRTEALGVVGAERRHLALLLITSYLIAGCPGSLSIQMGKHRPCLAGLLGGLNELQSEKHMWTLLMLALLGRLARFWHGSFLSLGGLVHTAHPMAETCRRLCWQWVWTSPHFDGVNSLIQTKNIKGNKIHNQPTI